MSHLRSRLDRLEREHADDDGRVLVLEICDDEDKEELIGRAKAEGASGFGLVIAIQSFCTRARRDEGWAAGGETFYGDGPGVWWRVVERGGRIVQRGSAAA